MRSHRVAWVVLALGMGLAGSQGQEGPAADPLAGALERARGAARALGDDLRRTLMEELAAGGPAQAVRVCAEVAQQRSAAHSTEGLTVRRVSLKPRNPADAPDPYERGALQALEEKRLAGTLPEESYEVVEDPAGRRLRYLRPILIGDPCLACHRDPASMRPEVKALLAERYPHDQAVGYRKGDLRGAVSVVVALP